MKYKGAQRAPLYFIPAILNYETYFGFSAPQALKTLQPTAGFQKTIFYNAHC
jgi:hypothetical protein